MQIADQSQTLICSKIANYGDQNSALSSYAVNDAVLFRHAIDIAYQYVMDGSQVSGQQLVSFFRCKCERIMALEL